jgi:hypothetical protein
MRLWGVRDVTIEILEWGSPEESLEILMSVVKVARLARWLRGFWFRMPRKLA